MNTFMNTMKSMNNYGYTENGAVTHRSTMNKVLDMFAMGGAYRNRTDADCILLFKDAYEAHPTLALRCLFYLRDARGGQGERRFFRVCFNWLAKTHPSVAKKQIEHISEYGRWDDVIYSCYGTLVWTAAMSAIRAQLALDVQCKTPSLLAKWLPSENASSHETKRMANEVRSFLNMSHKEYRKTLSVLRARVNVLERLMSANRWDEIEFDKIPSRAGFIYKNAFARRDLIAKKYEAFAKSAETKVNAKVLYPHEIAHNAFTFRGDDIERAMIQKYWDNLPDYYNGAEENGLAIVDTSGSMSGQPLEVAVSLGAYVAERGHGPFANHFVTFSSHPELIEFNGVDIVDKFNRARRADWQMNTDLKAVFDMLLNVARSQKTKPEDMPTRLYIFSDMEFDGCIFGHRDWWDRRPTNAMTQVNTLLESIKVEWARAGYTLPQVVFWNLSCRNNNIPAIGDGFSYISGFSPSMIETILSGKDGIDLMLQKLNSDRYSNICA